MYPDDRRALYRLTSSLIGRASRLGMEANLGPQVSERRPGPTFGDVTPDRVTGSLGAAVRVLGEVCQSSVGAVGAARLLLQLTVKRLWVSTDGLRSGAGAALLKRQWRLALLTARHPIGPLALRPNTRTHISVCDKGCVASQIKRPPLVGFHASCDGFPRGPMTLETSVLEFNAGALRCLFVKPNLDLAGHVQVRLEDPLRADIPTEDNANRRLVDEDARAHRHSVPSTARSKMCPPPEARIWSRRLGH